MIIKPLTVPGASLITRMIPIDERGYFSRIVDVKEFREAGINADFVQISLSQNYGKGTLRGLHSQTGSRSEDKLVVCTRGQVFDVCVDMRENSPTFLKYCSAVLSEDNGNSIYIPKGCAHGFITLTDNAQLIYFMTAEHDPSSEKGYRWDDPELEIAWPLTPVIMSEKDKHWPLIKR